MLTACRRALPVLLVAAVLATAAPASHAFLGALAKLGKAGSAAGKAAGAAGKGAAVVGGVEAAEAVGAGSKAAKAGAAADAAELSKASGLGPAVPPEVAAMLKTPGKTLADVPDVGTRAWLAQPRAKLTPADTDAMVRDYVKLLDGLPAAGPGVKPATSRPASLPSTRPTSAVPWHAVALVSHAAHAGHRAAQQELERLCAAPRDSTVEALCTRPEAQRAPDSPSDPAAAWLDSIYGRIAVVALTLYFCRKYLRVTAGLVLRLLRKLRRMLDTPNANT